tara:strand:- start:1828 stop:3495 length:1668 start_codon:yes stop_codon:yes gene_type:complete
VAVTPTQAAQILSVLRNPKLALTQFGQVHDQKTSQFVKFDPEKITYTMQNELLDYASNTPRTKDGQTKFLTVLTARQMGKSLTAEYACYPKAAYNPGWDHVCIADTRDRADYLHKRVHHLHQKWPAQLRTRTMTSRESRQLTFRPIEGGKMRILSGEAGAVGIGQSPDSFHASECAFWADFSGSMFLIWPSMANRDHALAIFECTPWEAKSDWHDHCLEAKKGSARHLYKFFPFWDGKLNVRNWDKSWTPDNEEIGLMDKFGPKGLTFDNLAFRRFMLEMDSELRRSPELFNVFYPFDDISCWITASNNAIPPHALKKHLDADLTKWEGPYMEYEQPEPDAYYVMGVDPSGHAARDHASFQVLKVWDGEWTQVASFADHIDPLAFSRKLEEVGRKYNKAKIVVESNGVGQSVIALLREWEYSNMYYEKKRKPGFTTTSKSIDMTLGYMVDALLDELILNDEDTLEQLQSYRNDKQIEESPTSEIARGKSSAKRRDRHHWDKISALQMAIVGARSAPRRYKHKPEDNIIDIRNYTYDERIALHKDKARQKRKKYWL